MGHQILEQARRRRTFAIISHPDAGKTTLTEKLLLYAGAVETAGAVKAHRGARAATSDWMELERQRGISITSSVLRFEHRGHVLNLLDTPGHGDFSEDTYRVLTAVDAAIMVLDAAKGLEERTLRLFEVCRTRGVPLLTFVNKCDRPAPSPIGILDEIEVRLGLRATPATWPVGMGRTFRGVVDRREATFHRFERTAKGATEAPEEALDRRGLLAEGEDGMAAAEEIDLLDAVGADLDQESFLAEQSTPVFFGSALWNFGVRLLLDAIVDLMPAPAPRNDHQTRTRGLEEPFSGQVFKVQANVDPRHRDRLAFVRVWSGRFDRGMQVTVTRSGRPFATSYAHRMFGSDRHTVDEAYPGDVVGLVNARDLRLGDTLYAGDPVEFPPIPAFAPEHFVKARPLDPARSKQFRRGLSQLGEEGVVQLLWDAMDSDPLPRLGAVGPLQFDVARYRLEHEFGAPVELSAMPYKLVRRTDPDGARSLADRRGVSVARRDDGVLLALFESDFWLERARKDLPDLMLEPAFTA